MRRRWVWFVFVPLAALLGGFVTLVMTGFLKALTFGQYDVVRLETSIAVYVTWIAIACAGVASAVAWWFRRRRDREGRTVFHEIASICMAVFFGGLLALSRVKGIDALRLIVPVIFIAWVIADAQAPQKAPWRKLFRASATAVVGLGTSALIHFLAR